MVLEGTVQIFVYEREASGKQWLGGRFSSSSLALVVVIILRAIGSCIAICVLTHLPLIPISRLPQQWLHCHQWLENPQHGQEQVVCVYGQDCRGETEVVGCPDPRAGTAREWVPGQVLGCQGG